VKKKRLNSCNVLETNPVAARLWHFVVEREGARLQSEATAALPQKLSAKTFVKDWHNLVQPRLNIAWLPADQVFLRVIQLPAADRQELLSMLEFQLEKLSPLPLPQIVWSVEVMPGGAENMQTAIICIVPRDVVEAYLDKLEEEQGYQADKLEIPQLNQILAGGAKEDGAWLYPGTGDESHLCMVAWWSAGVLQQVQLLQLPITMPVEGGQDNSLAARVKPLHEQLMQIAWAGELEGWLTLPVKWYLTADEPTTAQWEPIISAWSEDSVGVTPPVSEEALAQFSAARAAREEGTANLLPPEFQTKYRQQYVDRIWMGSLGALMAVYLIGVVLYLVALNFYEFRQGRVQAQVVSLGPTYTNVLQLKERAQVLQEQLNLKYAALDAFKVTSELLPPDFTLNNLVFSRGRLQLSGTAPQGQETNVTTFNEQMRNATISGRPVFKSVDTPKQSNRPGSPNVTWNFDAQMNVTE